MSLDQIVEGVRLAISRTSGDERRMYEAVLEYITTRQTAYEQEAKKYYRRLDYQAQRRADQVVDWLGQAAQYYS
jgi:hypothetical protein